MDLNNKTVFLAGATGSIGAAIIRNLLDNFPDIKIRATYLSCEPFIIDNRITYIKADLTIKEDCDKAILGSNFAILAAAETGGASSAKKMPHKQLTNNVVMDAIILESLWQHNVKRIVYLSSTTVYQPFVGFIKENQIDFNINPHSSYLGIGWAKRSAEKMCEFWSEKYSQEIITLRCSNIYGPYSKFDPANSNFIPALVRKAVNQMDPFEVWGSPDVCRDVIYVDDCATAVVKVLISDNISSGVFNLGTNIPTTVGEVVEYALRASEFSPSKINYITDGPTTIPLRALDCKALQEAINWLPQISTEEGVRRTVAWWKKNSSWWKK